MIRASLVKLVTNGISLQVKSKLKGHSKRITGLAFSHVLNVLVSSGADAQVDNVNLFFSPFAFALSLFFLMHVIFCCYTCNGTTKSHFCIFHIIMICNSCMLMHLMHLEMIILQLVQLHYPSLM